ncbi:MAG: ABC transporter ATP-binding protein [Tissierellia bacterium]|nr:ABC transporter ATP-binding protein [Tissierellia bacterium]
MHRRHHHTKKKIDFKKLGKLLKMLFKSFPVILPIALVAILITSAVRSIPSVFMERVISIVEDNWMTGNWDAAYPRLVVLLRNIAILYVISLATSVIYTQLMVNVTHGFSKILRTRMFSLMQKLPVRFFDQKSHGDIMSHYTNDIDTLRQFISQTLPQTLFSLVMVISVLGIMLYYSLWLTLAVLFGFLLIMLVTKFIGGNSAKFFRAQQASVGKAEGLVEEIMHGQKVVKVFNQEQEVVDEFEKLNEQLFQDSKRANTFANILMPIAGNIGNIAYVLVAILGGALIILNVPNVSISGAAISISIVVPFLNMTKQFMGNIMMLSNQINAVAMAMAGADRIFDMMEQEPESDEGKVRLVRAIKKGDVLEPHDTHTGLWAWSIKNDDGSFTYKELKGDVVLKDVNFGYEPDQPVLKNINLYAEEGQKVAFVGATGAGKTTITNLLNRFYDIDSGQITYDGIDIKQIRKSDLRRSMGLVLQDTNLFSGTVMENIKYGNLEATDGECIAAAKITGAHSFISRLPQGYDTYIDGNNDSLSQGQRQLISIARAAVLDPPVMVLDEATSSIDTRTESIVQQGMDELMKGRTVFVIAHRLSTIRNSDVIMVLDKGEIIERGNHEELLEKKGNYYQLYTGAFELE